MGFLVVLITLVPSHAQTPDYRGTLPEDYLPGLKVILESAVKQSPQMLLHELDIERQQARIYQNDSERWPQVGGNIRYDTNQTASTSSASSRDSGLFYSISANQAVFHWGEIKHRGDIARISTAIAEKDYAEGYRTLVVQLRQLYVGLIAKKALLRTKRYAWDVQKAELAAARETLAHGNATPGDVAVRELRISEMELELDRVTAELDGDRRRLSRLAGLKPDLPAEQIPDDIPALHFDRQAATDLLAAFLRDGAQGTFRAQVAELHEREADLDFRIAQVRLWPKFNASIGHTRESSTSATATQVSQTAITRDTLEVRGDWNIFDGFATKGFKREAIAQKRAWNQQREIEIETAMDEAQRLERAVGLDARAFALAQQHYDGGAAALNQAEQDRKTLKSVSETVVKAATQNLHDAEWNLAMARATFLADWSAFVSTVAEDPALKNLPPRYVRATP